MLFRIILSIAALLQLYAAAYSQQEQPVKNESYFQVITNIPKVMAVHIPKGYEVLDTTYGNLNSDSIQDVIIALKSPREDTSANPEYPVRRPLLILLGTRTGSYTFGFRNDKVIDCIICGGVMGDPFNGITIKNGFFTVEHSGGSSWRWTRYITFRFNPQKMQFYLHRIDQSSFHASKPDKIETTVKTQKNFGGIEFTKYDDKHNM